MFATINEIQYELILCKRHLNIALHLQFNDYISKLIKHQLWQW